MNRWIRIGRRAIDTLLIGLVVTVVVAVTMQVGASALGYDLVVIRGRSMEPAIGLGSVVMLERTLSTAVPRSGAIVAYRLESGSIVTHRVRRVVEADRGVVLETAGDANAGPDPVLVPLDRVIGQAGLVIPGLGFLLLWLGTPLGVISVVTFAAALFVAGMLLDELLVLWGSGRRAHDGDDERATEGIRP